MLGIPEIDQELAESLQANLEVIEAMMRDQIEGKYPLVIETSRHLVEAGGKRLRPLLTLLAAECGNGANDQVRKAAVVCELTHLATLYHDDVMDEAPLRRGVPSANSRWGNSVAILTGDYLFAKVSALLAELGPEAVAIHARTFERLVVGQIMETQGHTEGLTLTQHYDEVIAGKTGSLIAASARYGAMFGGVEPAQVALLEEFAERIGWIFQLADDIIDINSEAADSGKTPGTDLREGVPTLVTLRILESDNPVDGELRALLSAPIKDEAIVARVLAELRGHVVMREAKAELIQIANETKAMLAPLADRPAKIALLDLCDAIVNRSA